jgi:hypothetical protein
MTLVLHARGTKCASIEQFGSWTLLVYGPGVDFMVFGDLEHPKKDSTHAPR